MSVTWREGDTLVYDGAAWDDQTGDAWNMGRGEYRVLEVVGESIDPMTSDYTVLICDDDEGRWRVSNDNLALAVGEIKRCSFHPDEQAYWLNLCEYCYENYCEARS